MLAVEGQTIGIPEHKILKTVQYLVKNFHANVHTPNHSYIPIF
jgi:hypothetical protein